MVSQLIAPPAKIRLSEFRSLRYCHLRRYTLRQTAIYGAAPAGLKRWPRRHQSRQSLVKLPRRQLTRVYRHQARLQLKELACSKRTSSKMVGAIKKIVQAGAQNLIPGLNMF